MKKDVGELREYVGLYSNAPTDAGDQLMFVASQWCKIEPAGGRAVEIGAVTGTIVSHKITFRHLPTVQAGWTVVDAQGQKYLIQRCTTERRDHQEAWANLIEPPGVVSP